MSTTRWYFLALAATSVIPSLASAGLIRVGEDAFTSSTALITFDEVRPNVGNPVFEPVEGAGSLPTVTTGGWFEGQFQEPGCTGPGCLKGDPTAQLTLDRDSLPVVVLAPGDPPDAVLTGIPPFAGPISVLFDSDVNGIGFTANFFTDPNTNLLTVFDRSGQALASNFNDSAGSQFFGFADAAGLNSIAGFQFTYEAGMNSGFAIDDLRFGPAGSIDLPELPPSQTVAEPRQNILILFIGLIGLVAARRRRVVPGLTG